jgi:hypothetical protein
MTPTTVNWLNASQVTFAATSTTSVPHHHPHLGAESPGFETHRAQIGE